MSNDPLALSVLTVGPPRETEYDAVYAAVTATERGRWFLFEYAKRNRNADTDLIVAAVARIEATLRGDAPPQSSALPSADLTAMAAAIERVRGAVAAAALPMSGIGSAAERISDISFSLRERSIDAELCDALDAAAREISDACTSRAAEDDHARGVAESLRDLAGRMDALLKLSAAPVSREVPSQISNDAPSQVLSEGLAEVPNQGPDETSAAMLSSPIAEPAPVVAAQNEPVDAVMLPPAYGDDPDPPASAPTAAGPRWHIKSPDFVFAAADPAADKVEAEPAGKPEHFHALLPATELQLEPQHDPGPHDDPAGLFEASVAREAVASVPAPVSPPATPAPAPPELAAVVSLAKASQQPLRIANGSAVRAGPPPVPGDPLAAMRSLSEDEVVALFG